MFFLLLPIIFDSPSLGKTLSAESNSLNMRISSSVFEYWLSYILVLMLLVRDIALKQIYSRRKFTIFIQPLSTCLLLFIAAKMLVNKFPYMKVLTSEVHPVTPNHFGMKYFGTDWECSSLNLTSLKYERVTSIADL